jgi:CubicO group peptidase (beta-lactamase class C family)
VYSTPRDLARFGLLFLNDGVWNGERILPEGWVAYSTRQTPAQDPRSRSDGWGYGAQWWLLGTDSYTSAGRRGQFTTVVPSQEVVVVRTGLDPEPSRWDQAGFVARVLDTSAR